MSIIQKTPFRQITKAYSAILDTNSTITSLSEALRTNQEPTSTDGLSDQIGIFDRMGFKLLLNQASIVDRCLVHTGSWEPVQLAFMASITEKLRGRKNTAFLDIGSYFGLYSLIALRSKAFEKLYAFEGDRNNYAHLQANLLLNGAIGPISTFNNAVSEKSGTVNFWDSRSHPDGNYGGVGIVDESDARQKYTVEAISIDETIKGEGAHILMKLDVEGHEEFVLRGMRYTVSRNKVVMQLGGCRTLVFG
jgi:FkbM family methyltransferase